MRSARRLQVPGAPSNRDPLKFDVYAMFPGGKSRQAGGSPPRGRGPHCTAIAQVASVIAFRKKIASTPPPAAIRPAMNGMKTSPRRLPVIRNDIAVPRASGGEYSATPDNVSVDA